MLTYVVAGTHREAALWARVRALQPSDFRYVSSSASLRGLHQGRHQVAVLDEWWFARRQVWEVLDIAHALRACDLRGVAVIDEPRP